MVLMRRVDELTGQLQKSKAKSQGDQKDLAQKLKERDSEIEVLKEMLRSSRLQLKSKDTDIQRLNIKIKRLEKTNEIRENMINQVAHSIKNGKDIDPQLLQPGSITGAPRKVPGQAGPMRPSPSSSSVGAAQHPKQPSASPERMVAGRPTGEGIASSASRAHVQSLRNVPRDPGREPELGNPAVGARSQNHLARSRAGLSQGPGTPGTHSRPPKVPDYDDDEQSFKLPPIIRNQNQILERQKISSVVDQQ